MEAFGTSQNEQEAWRTHLEKEGTKATVDFQVSRIIHCHGQENIGESVWDFLLKFQSWERLTGQLWARNFPLAEGGGGELGTLFNSFNQ